jgi:hypothetical protein
MASPEDIVPVERIAAQIFVIRGESVLLDSDLAELYEIATGNLNRAVSRNVRRFPEDFCFRLSDDEYDALIFQPGRSNTGRGGRRKLPWVFTEHGVAMLSSVLRSDRAADVNVAIMRTFVRLRRILTANEELERKVAQHDEGIGILFEHIQHLLEPGDALDKRKIGFRSTGK